MSEPHETPADGGEDMVAAEYALGVLDAHSRGEAERRMAEDSGFAREVERWTARLAPLADQIIAEPAPEGVWRAVERRLQPAAGASASAPGPGLGRDAAANVVELDLRRRLRLWRNWSAVATAAAAVMLVVIASPNWWPRPVLIVPQPVVAHPIVVVTPARAPAAAPPLMIARLASKGGAADFVVAYQPQERVVTVTPASVTAVDGRSPELWLLPTGGKPVALGVVSFERPLRLATAPDMGGAGRLALAVSVEPQGGSPTGQPTGPVIATGELQRT